MVFFLINCPFNLIWKNEDSLVTEWFSSVLAPTYFSLVSVEQRVINIPHCEITAFNVRHYSDKYSKERQLEEMTASLFLAVPCLGVFPWQSLQQLLDE